MSTREMALAAYRHVIRAANLAFRGDTLRLTAARSAAREGFEANRSTPANEAPEQIQHAEGVAQVLRENVVQGQAADTEGSKYKLRIHEHTERGDNETLMGNRKGKVTGKCGQL